MSSGQATNSSSASGVTYSILAGMSAASASVFGKLAVDPTVVHRLLNNLDLQPAIVENVNLISD